MATRKFNVNAINEKKENVSAVIYCDKNGKITGSSHPDCRIAGTTVILKNIVGVTVWHINSEYNAGIEEIPKNKTQPNPVV